MEHNVAIKELHNIRSNNLEIFYYKNNLEYIIKNKIVTGHRLIDEKEYDPFEFIGRCYEI